MSEPSPTSDGAAPETAPSAVQSILPRAILEQGQLIRRDPRIPQISSQALDWPGTLLEVGTNDVTEADDVVLRQHYLSLNVDTSPVILEVAGPHGFRPHTIVPGALWVCASAEPISLRLDSSFSYVRLSLDPRHLGRLVGAAEAEDTGVRLRRIVGLALPQVAHLLQTLRAEARDGNPNGLAFVEAVTGALGRLLIRHAGLSAPAPLPRGRLSPGVRTRTLEVIDAHLSARLTVEQLAREVGLSPAHFARAFKETMGRPPYQYLLTLRLERARQLLDRPEARLADVAFETGFADQAHFTRLFKRAYGLPPGAVMRRNRR